MPALHRRFLVVGKAGPFGADAGKRSDFGKGVTDIKRANAAGGLTHGYPPG